MKETAKKILTLCMAVAMLAGMGTTAWAAKGTTVYLKSMQGYMDNSVSLSNVVGRDSKKYPADESGPAYICNSPAEIKAIFGLNFFEVNKLELVNGIWTPVKEVPVIGDSILLFWDNETGTEVELTIGYGEHFDLDGYEKAHPRHALMGARYAGGSKVTLTEKGVYRVGISGPGRNPDNVNAIVVVEDGGAAPATVQAKPTASSVLVNGKATAFDAYNISGNNYFKLRDLAYALNSSDKQFEVKWDGANNAILLISGKSYTPAGNEMQRKGGGAKNATPTASKILLDGTEITLTAYNIGGNNYFKLRDLGAAFDFGVEWDGAKNAISIDTTAGYL